MSNSSIPGKNKFGVECLESNNGNNEVATTLAAIEKSLDTLNLSFNIDALDVLQNDYATPADIEVLKDSLGPTVLVRLYGLANSTYYGRASSGHITKFKDVINRLGTNLTRSCAIFASFLEMSYGEDMRLVMARSFATSKIVEAITPHLIVPTSKSNLAKLGGLFMEIGKLIILLYAYKENVKIKDEFYRKYHARIGVLVIDKFGLPPELKDIIQHSCFTFEGRESFAPSAISDMAYRIVEESFREHGKLVVQSVMPDPEGILYQTTVGSDILTQFISMGLGEYAQVIPTKFTEVEQRLLNKGATG
jgi:hypothetical protein